MVETRDGAFGCGVRWRKMYLEGKDPVGSTRLSTTMNRSKIFKAFVILANVVVISCALSVGVSSGEPGLAFKEHALATHFSVLQLGMCALASGLSLCFVLFSSTKKGLWECLFWVALVAGFAFAALDELFMYHERLDKTIHALLSIKQTPWTDRFDDLIVGLYVGLGTWLVLMSSKIDSFLDQSKYLFVRGFTVAFIMVGLDLLTNGRDFMAWLFGQDLGLFLRTWLSILEDCLKLVAVAIFLIGLAQNADLLWSKSRLVGPQVDDK